jgi:exodeoxyribonuclease V alpha subunit
MVTQLLRQTELSPLAIQFAKFCSQLDDKADDLALITAAILADRNTQGDTCLDLSALKEKTLLHGKENKPLKQAPDLKQWLTALDCKFVGEKGEYQPLILDGNRLYLHRHWQEEKTITEILQSSFGTTDYDSALIKQRLNALFDANTADDNAFGQKLAAAMALTRKLTIITGGPGTGKTTTVTKILALLLEQHPNLRILLAAPTGKAAVRLTISINNQLENLKQHINSEILEKLPRDASTIHRLLGWRPHGFEHNKENPLPCDCILLDETSMVDQGLMASLLSALPENCRIILLGDRDQLSSVEAGSVLGDLTGHGQKLSLSTERATELNKLLGQLPTDIINDKTPAIADHIAQLTHSYRFAKGGGIGKLAYAINNSDTKAIDNLRNASNDELDWIEANGQQPGNAVIKWAVEHYKTIFKATTVNDALKAFESTRLLTALRKGPWGATQISQRIEAELQRTEGINLKNNAPYLGLPVIIYRNDRETGLFNGDTGIFWKDEQGELMAWFEIKEELTAFSVHQLPEWKPAWTLTVHRSQGSEYNNVLLVLPPEVLPVVTRELIYTGVTRAAKKCTLVANWQHFKHAVDNDVKRFSGLNERIGWHVNVGE